MLELFTKYVNHYAAALGLTPRWRIWITEEELPPRIAAQCVCMEDSHVAWIKLNRDWPQLDAPRIRPSDEGWDTLFPVTTPHLAAHEVLHIAFNDLDSHLGMIVQQIPEPAPAKGLINLAMRAEEAVIDMMAEIVVKAYPYSEEKGDTCIDPNT